MILGLVVALAQGHRPHYNAVFLTSKTDSIEGLDLTDSGEVLLEGNRVWRRGKTQKISIPPALVPASNGENRVGVIVRLIGPHGEYAGEAGGLSFGAMTVSAYSAFQLKGDKFVESDSGGGTACAITGSGNLLWSEDAGSGTMGPDPNPPDGFSLDANGKSAPLGLGQDLRVNQAGTIAGDVPIGQWPSSMIPPIDVGGPVKPVADAYAQDYRAFILINGKRTEIGPGKVAAINDSGTVVGYRPKGIGIGTPPEDVLFGEGWIWRHGHRTAVSSPKFTMVKFTAINNAGEVIGTMSGLSRRSGRAFISRELIDLNGLTRLPPGWRLSEAVDINNRGEILCEASHEGVRVPVLLKP